MSDKINLGVFEFDGDRIQKEIANLKSQIDQTSVSVREAKNISNQYAKDIVALAKEQKRLTEAGEENSKTFLDNKDKLNKLQKQQNIATKELTKHIVKQKELKTEYNDGVKVLQAHLKAQDLNIDAYTTEGKSIRELRRENQALTTLRNELKTAVGEEAEEIQKLNKIIDENTEAQKDNVNKEQKRFYQIGKYKEELSGSFTEIKNSIDALKSGDFVGFSNGVKAGFKGMGASAKAFFVTLISNPITATIAILGALAVATVAVAKEFWDYNESIKESVTLTQQITKLQGKQADAARNQAQAYTDSFGGDFKDNLKTAKELVTDFGISYSDAFEQMREKTIRGADANGEFADSIDEYGALFKQRGYDVNEFLNILNAGADLGFYKDKLPDAIKEAGNELTTEGSKARKELENLFGTSFKDTIVNGINDGSVTVKDALDEINKKVDETELNQTQLQSLTSSLFISAGEDGAGAVKIFEALNYAVENSQREFTDLEQKTYDLANAQLEFQNAKDAALKSDTLIKFQQDSDVAWLEIKTGWYQFVDFFGDSLSDLERWVQSSSSYIRGSFQQIPKTAIKSFELIKQAFSELLSDLRSGGSALQNFLTGDFDKAQADYDKFKGGFRDFTNDLKKIGAEARAEIANAGDRERKATLDRISRETKAAIEYQKEQERSFSKTLSGINQQIRDLKSQQSLSKTKEEYNLLQKKIDALEVRASKITGKKTVGSGSSSPTVNKAGGKLKQAQKEALQVIKETNSALAEQADITSRMAQVELSQWIANNASKIESDKRLTDALLEQETKRLENLKQKQNEALEIEKQGKELRLQQEIDLLEQKKSLSEAEKLQLQNLQSEKLLIEQEFALRKQEQDAVIQEQIDELKNEKLEQDKEDEAEQIAIEAEEKLLRLEEENASQFEFQQQLALQNYEKEKADLKKRYNEGEISKENFEREKANIEKAYANVTKQIEEKKQQTKVNLANQALSSLSSVLDKETAAGKAVAVAQAIMNTAQGVTKALADDGVMGIVTGAIVAGVGAYNISKILSTKPPKRNSSPAPLPKAQRGMITQGASHANGGIPASVNGSLIELEGGEAIINKHSTAMFTPLLSRLNELGGGVKFARGGVPASNMQTIQNYITRDLDTILVEKIGQAVAEGARAGTYTGSQKGMTDLSTNRQIANGANHG